MPGGGMEIITLASQRGKILNTYWKQLGTNAWTLIEINSCTVSKMCYISTPMLSGMGAFINAINFHHFMTYLGRCLDNTPSTAIRLSIHSAFDFKQAELYEANRQSLTSHFCRLKDVYPYTLSFKPSARNPVWWMRKDSPRAASPRTPRFEADTKSSLAGLFARKGMWEPVGTLQKSWDWAELRAPKGFLFLPFWI